MMHVPNTCEAWVKFPACLSVSTSVSLIHKHILTKEENLLLTGVNMKLLCSDTV